VTSHLVNVVMSGVFHAAILFLVAAGLQVGEIVFAGPLDDARRDATVGRIVGGAG